MKPVLLAALLALATTGASAQPRPSTQTLTCSQAAGLVASRGAIVMNTSRTAYDRFVAARGFCAFGEVLEPVWAPTRDVAQCFIGYRCNQNDDDDFFFRRW
ncbi:MAG TPA: hypothetical protein VGU24_05585 [Microvirga sp.]|nr:hypothetical protein [Microvirga sp.]